jgi:prevent-host-death family protein
MIQIRPVSDLRNKFPEIERVVNGGETVYLTKNGYGAMVVMSLARYSEIADDIETRLDEADRAAEASGIRYAHEDVFSRVSDSLRG